MEPYKLVEREMNRFEEDVKKVMLEDGLEDVKNLFTDSIGAKYFRMVNSVSFSDICSYQASIKGLVS